MITENQIKTIVTAIIGIVAVLFGLTTDQQAAIIPIVMTLVMVVIAWLNGREVTTVKEAFTSGTTASETPAIIKTLPDRAWKMSSATRIHIVKDATPTNAARILQQIDAAEAEYKTHYRVNFTGGYHIIDYGLIQSSVGNSHYDVGTDGKDLTDQFYTHPRTGRVWASKELAIQMDGAITVNE